MRVCADELQLKQTVIKTCDMIVGQVKASLDYNLASAKMFQARLVECHLVSEVITPVLEIFSVQAEELGLRIQLKATDCVSADPRVLID